MAGRPAPIHRYGSALLSSRLLTKDLAFPPAERDVFRLHGLLPDRVLTIEEQVDLEVEHLRRKGDDLERYIGLAALQDRNATLFYRVLAEHLEEFLPIVYTPTVGRACQEFSHIIRRTRGTWITPADRDRIPELLRNGPFDDVRLIVVTDNERILGLGDQGAGGMAIPVGKLALYTAACGIHPSLTLPVSLDVGTDNPELLADPLYLGYRAPRLRGEAYDSLVEAFVAAVDEVWPGCLIQWEDFLHHNALRILDRYRDRICSFNDDIQGTSAVVVGGRPGRARRGRRPHPRALRARRCGRRREWGSPGCSGWPCARPGASDEDAARALVLVDSHGLVHAGRTDLDPTKREFARSLADCAADGFDLGSTAIPGLQETVERVRPTVLVGHDRDGRARSPSRSSGRWPPRATDRSSCPSPTPPTRPRRRPPTSWPGPTAGRSSRPGAPSRRSAWTACEHLVGQANNVFVFPGLGLGAIVAEARVVTDGMVLAAARALASEVPPERLAEGALYPSVESLRAVSRAVAVAVVREAVSAGVSRLPAGTDLEAEVDRSMWWPDYVPYVAAAPGLDA